MSKRRRRHKSNGGDIDLTEVREHICALFDERYEEAMDGAEEAIERYLATHQIRRAVARENRRGQMRRNQETLSAERLAELAEDPAAFLDDGFLSHALSSHGVYAWIFRYITEGDEEIERFRDGRSMERMAASGGMIVNMRAGEQKKQIYQELRHRFPEGRLLNCLHENPIYRRKIEKALRRYQIAQILTDDLLSSVPDNYAMLYPEARSIHRHFILHIGPTNSGKTHDAIRALARAKTGIYLAPLRLLAYEQYETLTDLGVACSMITGEERILTRDSTHQSSTVEMLDTTTEYDVAVIDEAQMIADWARGGAWTTAILGVNAAEVHVCAAPNAEECLAHMIETCGDEFETVYHHRKVPLIAGTQPFHYPRDIEPGDALIVFSRRDVHACAADLADLDIPCSVIYGALPYDVRHSEAERFASGETTVIVATDAIGMGMNLPIRRIVFIRTEKFDGKKIRPLMPAEIKQIAGRAGRFGKYDTGFALSYLGGPLISEGLKTIDPPIEKAVIDIPETFFLKEGKVSDILEAWDAIPATQDYDKADIRTKIELARELEEYSDNKELIREFVSMTFDEETPEVRGVWFDLFLCIDSGTSPDLEGVYRQYDIRGDGFDPESAQKLETMYKVYDLLYGFCSKYGSEDDLSMITERKRKISDLLMKKFEENAFERSRCTRCGRRISWLSPYKVCDRCFRNRRQGIY